MDTLLKNGEHALNSAGMPTKITGINEILQRAAIRLSVKRGSMPYDPELGSRLYTLQNGEKESINRKALSFAVEALRLMPEVSAVSADCTFFDTNTLNVKINLKNNSKIYSLEVNI